MSDIDRIYDIIDGLMSLGAVKELNCFLLNYERESSVDVLLALLVSTLPVKNSLPGRSHIIQKVKDHKNYQEGLLNGLV